MKKALTIAFLIFTLSNTAVKSNQQADSNYQNPRVENDFGITALLGGPTYFFAAQLDYFLIENINIYAGGGGVGYYYGINLYYSNSNSSFNWSPYIGFCIGKVIDILNTYAHVASTGEENDLTTNYYIPIGIQYMDDNGHAAAIEFAARSDKNLNINYWASIKFSYYF